MPRMFSDDDLDVMLRMVHVRHHGHDGRDCAALRDRRGHEDGNVGVAGEVSRSADAVHDLRAQDVGRIHVAVDVGLDHPVHGNDAQSSDNLGVVADFLRSQNDSITVARQIGVKARQCLRRQR